jgi:hypothetical protein
VGSCGVLKGSFGGPVGSFGGPVRVLAKYSYFIGKMVGALANYLYLIGKRALTEQLGSKFTPFRSRKQKKTRKYLPNRPRARILSATLGESTNVRAYKTRIKVHFLHFCNTSRVKMRFLEHSEFPEREPTFE